MAKKPFFSLEEACARLGRSEDQVKALVREGSLREFRDAGKVFFKAEDIERLAAKSAPTAADDTGEILLEAVGESDDAREGSTSLPSLVESSGGTSIIGLEPIGEEADEPSAPVPPPPGGKKKGDTVLSSSGIGVFDQDELEIEADPLAKTQITTGRGEDQISLEGAGSGSGLLDLAREADDTALGADLLDEIYPGEEEKAPARPAPPPRPAPAPVVAAAEPDEAEEADAGESIAAPIRVPAGDPYEGMMAGLLCSAVIVLALATTVMGGLVQGFVPEFAKLLTDGTNIYIFLGGAVGLALICLLAGWFLGRASAPRAPRAR